MRVRAGVILIEDGKVALIERYRAGKHYYVFPGGGMDEGETPEQAAVREMEEETGLHVAVRYKVAEIHFDLSIQHYFLVEKIGGEFGSGTGEEFTDADPDNPAEGVYIPTWMPLAELSKHDNVYPANVAELVVNSISAGWLGEPVLVVEKIK
ncbi:MAG: NUDIX domain-containing protein [Anaerolineales bacterium]|nr:NUDIX domain-containing protein [Anaerolineales bacterium]